jgi:hypothetical protein
MKHKVVYLLIGITMSLALACPRQGAELSEREFQFHVVNRSPYDVCYVHTSAENADGWGVDRLGSDEVIRPGAKRSFALEAGIYKALFRDCDGIPVLSTLSIGSEMTVTVGADDVVALRLDNRSSVAICNVYLKPSDRALKFPPDLFPLHYARVPDRMTDPERIAPNAARIFYIAPSQYDLMASDCEHNALVRELQVELTEALTIWSLTD